MNQAAASRINGAKSNEPVTPEGRAISAQNSRKHGLTGGPAVLPNESQEEYDSFCLSFMKRFQPSDEVELDLISEMADARWRMRRIANMESALVQHAINKKMEEMGEEGDPETAQLLAYADLAENSKGLRLLNRYAKDLRRAYEKAFKEFLDLHVGDLAQPPQPVAPETTQPEPEPGYSDLRNEPRARNDAFIQAVQPYFAKQQAILGTPLEPAKHRAA